MDDAKSPDKSGTELNQQRFHMLEDIAKDLAHEVIFPTSFDLVTRLRKVLQDPDISIDQVASFVTLEPLMSARLISLANSAAYASSGKVIKSVHDAVLRLGLNAVRTTGIALAMNQLLRAKEVAKFSKLADNLWQHSLHTAAAAELIARRMTRINPEEALLAGLVHDLGAFYMLYRSSQYEELRERPDTIKHLIIEWHESIGHAVLIALGIPEDIADAMREHDQPRPIPARPRNLADVVYVANLLAGGIFEWLGRDAPASADQYALTSEYLELAEEISLHEREMRSVFS
jgi:putative nucleotidyltransferase with HDIG domain